MATRRPRLIILLIQTKIDLKIPIKSQLSKCNNFSAMISSPLGAKQPPAPDRAAPFGRGKATNADRSAPFGRGKTTNAGPICALLAMGFIKTQIRRFLVHS